MTYVEVKFGLKIRDSKPSDTGSRGQSDLVDVDAVNSLSSGKGKGSSSSRDGCFNSGGACFEKETAMFTQLHAKAMARKAIRASHGPRVSPQSQAKELLKRTMENPKKNPMVPKGPNGRTRAKPRKLVSQVLKTRNQRQARKLRNLHRHVPLTLPRTMVGIVTNGTMAGVLMDGMMTGALLDGTKVGNKRMTIPQTHFHLEVVILVP